MVARPISSRRKIISAAAELAGEVGPANLSLEAIAARAGLSKGGLLYNFPSKAKLLEAIVQQYVDDFEAALEATRNGLAGRNPTARAFLTQFFRKLDNAEPPPNGILAALGEGLNFLEPSASTAVRCSTGSLPTACRRPMPRSSSPPSRACARCGCSRSTS